ncbi:hypothetical protein [Nocardia acidivorans]|uniref:hypothetical protein n=1 Tax=Nocardia acidivorans TaxID=404580 RepID=UPI000A44650A|nr:hypothetical protein [Nocardia acidivorans]
MHIGGGQRDHRDTGRGQVLKARGRQVPGGLTAAVVANEFIDTTKGLTAQG